MFTDTISVTPSAMNNSFVSNKIVVKKHYLVTVNNITTPICNLPAPAFEEKITSLDINLLAEPSEYSSVYSTFYIDGKADNSFRFYLNGKMFHEVDFGLNVFFPGNPDAWYRGQYSQQIDLTQQNNSLLITVYSNGGPYGAVVYTASITITTVSK